MKLDHFSLRKSVDNKMANENLKWRTLKLKFTETAN